ncbi:MAG TPA: hypothetical protein VMV79_01105 [Alphaproteobacteria bacterium]|nr:hypothetical protein [Alphaproteobacteria bacterium]
MRFAAAIFICVLMLGIALPAHADLAQVQAGELAMANNCPPKKIDVYRASIGSGDSTTYKVECTMPKVTDPNAPKGNGALLIRCDGELCQILDPMAAGK